MSRLSFSRLLFIASVIQFTRSQLLESVLLGGTIADALGNLQAAPGASLDPLQILSGATLLGNLNMAGLSETVRPVRNVVASNTALSTNNYATALGNNYKYLESAAPNYVAGSIGTNGRYDSVSNSVNSKANSNLAVSANSNLANGNLANSYLANSNLANSNLANSYLANSNLANSNLANSYLANSNLANSNLANGHLANSNLANRDLVKSNVAYSNLANNNLATENQANINANLAKTLANINQSNQKVISASAKPVVIAVSSTPEKPKLNPLSQNVLNFPLTVSSGYSDLPLGFHVAANNLEIGGSVAVNGQMPFNGVVSVNGNVPTEGTATVSQYFGDKKPGCGL